MNKSLDIYTENGLDYKKIMALLGLDKSDIARLSGGIKVDSVRFDERASEQVVLLFLQLGNILELAMDRLNSEIKVKTWLLIDNPVLGDKPINYIKNGKHTAILNALIKD